jgi:hypothetical protein
LNGLQTPKNNLGPFGSNKLLHPSRLAFSCYPNNRKERDRELVD